MLRASATGKSLIMMFLCFFLASQIMLIFPPIWRVNASTELALQGTERLITSNPFDQFSPAISDNIISYTDYRGVDADIWYYNLASGTEHSATTAVDYQDFSDVSEGVIVYYSHPFDGAYPSDVYAHFISTNQTVNLSQNGVARLPSIDRGLVAWESGGSYIHAMNLATNEVRLVSNYGFEPNVNNGRIVYQKNLPIRMLNPYHIIYYDWASNNYQQLTYTGINDYGQRYPHIDGNNVVYQNGTRYNGDVCLYNLTSGAETKWLQPSDSWYSYPVINRDFVAFSNYNVTSSISHIILLYLPTGSLFTVNVNSASNQWLGDIDGNRIVYADDRNGQTDIYMYEFTLQPPPPQSVGGISGITDEPIPTLTQYTALIAAIIGIMTVPKVILKARAHRK